MSQAVVDRLNAQFGERVLETSDAFGDHEVVVALKDWVEVAQFINSIPSAAFSRISRNPPRSTLSRL